jgi:hypothetical protein
VRARNAHPTPLGRWGPKDSEHRADASSALPSRTRRCGRAVPTCRLRHPTSGGMSSTSVRVRDASFAAGIAVRNGGGRYAYLTLDRSRELR